jgi:hypothetical protein
VELVDGWPTFAFFAKVGSTALARLGFLLLALAAGKSSPVTIVRCSSVLKCADGRPSGCSAERVLGPELWIWSSYGSYACGVAGQ